MSFIRFDEQLDVLDSLEASRDFLIKSMSEARFLKWVVISIHNALQGAMACHLSGPMEIGALKEEVGLNWIAYHDGRSFESKLLVHKLAATHELFRRLHNRRKRTEESRGSVLNLSSQQKGSFKRLNSIRNDFAHFTPKGWSIEARLLPDVLLHAIEIILKINADGYAFRHLDDENREEITALLTDLTEMLTDAPTGKIR